MGVSASLPSGEMAEWLKAHAWKACILERVSRVRIPVSPPALPCPNGTVPADRRLRPPVIATTPLTNPPPPDLALPPPRLFRISILLALCARFRRSFFIYKDLSQNTPL